MKKILLIILILPLILKAQNNYTNFKGKKIQAIGTFQFSDANYYDYVLNSNNITDSIYVKKIIENNPESLLTIKHGSLLDKNEEKIINKIYLFSKINIQYNQDSYCVIKFKIFENDKFSDVNFFVLKKDSNIWKEYIQNNSIVKDIQKVLSLKNDAYSQFEISDNDSKFPEINKLKPLVKDADGVLNIHKLAVIIENNKELLSKYFE